MAAVSSAGPLQPPPTPQQQPPSLHSTTSNATCDTASSIADKAARSSRADQLASPAAHRMADDVVRNATLPPPGYAPTAAAATLDPANASAVTALPPNRRPYNPLDAAMQTRRLQSQQPTQASPSNTVADGLTHGADDQPAFTEATPSHRAYNPLRAAAPTSNPTPQQSMPENGSSAAGSGRFSQANSTTGAMPPTPIRKAYNPLRTAAPIFQTPQEQPLPASAWIAAEPGLTQDNVDEYTAVRPAPSSRAYNPLRFSGLNLGAQPHQPTAPVGSIGAAAGYMHGAGSDPGVMAATLQPQAHDIRTACRGYYPPTGTARQGPAPPSAIAPPLYRPVFRAQHAQHGAAT